MKIRIIDNTKQPLWRDPSQSEIEQFLNLKRFDSFKKKSEELIAKYSKSGFHYQWLLEHSNFGDVLSYDRLILIVSSEEFGEENRIFSEKEYHNYSKYKRITKYIDKLFEN